jgi:uncharacterized OB-fold protein
MPAAPVRDGLFGRDDDGTPFLVGGRCRECGRDHFPAQSSCPYCGADGAEEIRLPATGRLWGWTSVLTAPPGYRGEVPFGFGVVELDGDGLRVVTRLEEADPGRLKFGQPVRLVVVTLHSDDEGNPVETYSFEVT